MSLLCAFYLYKPVSRKGSAPWNRKYEDKYEAMKIIRSMIKPESKDRATIYELKKQIGDNEPVSDEKMSDMIQSLRYKNRPK